MLILPKMFMTNHTNFNHSYESQYPGFMITWKHDSTFHMSTT